MLQTTNSLIFTVNPPVGNSVLLENFNSLRLNGDGTSLFAPYLGEDLSQTGSLDSSIGAFKVVVGGGSNGIYMHFFPRSGGYSFPQGYAQNYKLTGNWNILFNRLRFWVKVNKNITRDSGGGSRLEIGTYIREHNNNDAAYQGRHFYHICDPNFYANKWHLVEINNHPQHEVGNHPNINYPNNPSLPAVNYMDGLTRFYFDSQGTGFNSSTWWFDDFIFDKVDNEPDTLVSSIFACYTGTKYEVTWDGPKNVNQTFDIAYKTTSMKTSGFASGTPAGTATNLGSAYTGCIWQSPAMVENSNGMYVAIKPQGQALFTEIFIAKRV